jgi:hypothetical protein
MDPRPSLASRLRAQPLGAGLALLLVAGLLFQIATYATRDVDAWGWDESTHVELPAARLVLASGLRARLDVLNDCDQYPFVVPVYLAGVQALFGIDEAVARGALFGLWLVLGVGGLAVLGRSLARRMGLPAQLALLLPLLAFLSPLVWRYAPSLFIEVPFLVVATWTLVAWLGRQGTSENWSKGRELLAGALVAACFFTKFNYGGLFALALALDWLAESVGEVRGRRLLEQSRRTLWLAAPFAVVGFWWFIHPWPGDLTRGEAHLETLKKFLGGNLEMRETPPALRLMHWATGAFAHFAWLFLALLGLGAALLRRTVDSRAGLPPAMRCLWLVLVMLVVPPLLHPFHLDRFLIPGLLPIWALGAVGASVLFSRPRVLAVLGLGATVLWLVLPAHVLANRLGLLAADPERQAYQTEVMDELWSLDGQVPTAGLPRATHERLSELIAAEVRPEERVGWLGMSSEYSRAALHLALLERGGSRERFLRDAQVQMDLVPVPGKRLPELSQEQRLKQLRAFAGTFDVILISTPTDLKDRARPGFYGNWQAPLVSELGWVPRELGTVAVPRPGRPDLEVILFALRSAGDSGGE